MKTKAKRRHEYHDVAAGIRCEVTFNFKIKTKKYELAACRYYIIK